MQSNLHSKEITTAQVASVSFGFFNDEEASAEQRKGAACREWTANSALHQGWSMLRTSPAAPVSQAGRESCARRPDRLAAASACHSPLPVASAPLPARCSTQVRKISVKQVVSPIIFDNMKTPVKGGLYDPAFGPMDPKERCGALLLACCCSLAAARLLLLACCCCHQHCSFPEHQRCKCCHVLHPAAALGLLLATVHLIVGCAAPAGCCCGCCVCCSPMNAHMSFATFSPHIEHMHVLT